MEPYDVIVNQPVVIDNGSGVIKAGFAGDQVRKEMKSGEKLRLVLQGAQVSLSQLHWATEAQQSDGRSSRGRPLCRTQGTGTQRAAQY